MKNINRIQNKRSNSVSNGLPSTPSASDIEYGELAINYRNGIETIFTKNDNNEIASFSSDDYYTDKKLGSGFTGENSANTVTSVIEDEAKVTSAALNFLNGRLNVLSSDSETHITDNTIHVTASDKASWNSKANSNDGGNTADKASSLPFGKVALTSTDSALLVNGISGITELKDGVCFWGYNPSFTPTTASTLNVNGLGAKPMVASNSANSRSNAWTSGTTFMFVYDTSKENGNGAWVISYGYDMPSDSVLDVTTSASTNAIQTQAVFKVIKEDEEITAAALNDFNKTVGDILNITEENEEVSAAALYDLNNKIGSAWGYWKNLEDSAVTYSSIIDMLNYNIQYVKDNFMQKPVVLWQTNGTSGLLGANDDPMDLTSWQVENLDFSPYKYVIAYFKQSNLGSTSTSATPSVMVCIPLDSASLSTQYSAYIGGANATNMNDASVHYCVLCAIDSTKTKFKVLTEYSISGTTTSQLNTDGRYCYKIEGHY